MGDMMTEQECEERTGHCWVIAVPLQTAIRIAHWSNGMPISELNQASGTFAEGQRRGCRHCNRIEVYRIVADWEGE